MSPFRREPPRLWPGVLESVPAAFTRFLREPAFVLEETTFCLWRQATDSTWKQGAIDFPSAQDPDGSQELLSLLCGEPHAYQSWAQDYYECEIPLAAVEAIFEHRTLTKRLLQQLNPDIALADLSGDLQEIAYSILPR